MEVDKEDGGRRTDVVVECLRMAEKATCRSEIWKDTCYGTAARSHRLSANSPANVGTVGLDSRLDSFYRLENLYKHTSSFDLDVISRVIL